MATACAVWWCSDLLAAFKPATGSWRPARGLAEKLRRFAMENEQALARIRVRAKRDRVMPPPAVGSGSGSGDGDNAALQSELVRLAEGQKRLSRTVEEMQEKFDARLDKLMGLLERDRVREL